jgi:hypothetical protein
MEQHTGRVEDSTTKDDRNIWTKYPMVQDINKRQYTIILGALKTIPKSGNGRNNRYTGLLTKFLTERKAKTKTTKTKKTKTKKTKTKKTKTKQ